MFKKLFAAIAVFVLGFVAVSSAHADSTVSVRLQNLPSQSNRSDLTVTFTALDTNNNPITVYCYKKGPSDGSFSQFYGPITLSNGGNTDQCQAGGSVITQDGTYQFYVTATDGVNTATSGTATVTINRQTPGAPTGYSKQKINDCTYKISFHTSNDGKTVKVELYDSQNTSFSVDNGTRVNSMGIGSDQDGSFTQGVGDCSKPYYFAIRAFDSYGNGSGVVGDSSTTTTTINPTGTTSQGAIPVSGSGSSANQGVLGAKTSPSGEVTPAATEKSVLGNETTPAAEKATQEKAQSTTSSVNNWLFGGIIAVILLGIVIVFLRKQSQKTTR